MEIFKLHKDIDYYNIDNFFGKLWKDEFNIDCYNQIDSYKKCDIYFLEEEDNKIISSIIYTKYKDGKNYIWRFGTLKDYRGKGYGTILIKFIIKKYKGPIYLNSDPNQIKFYKKFGFVENGEDKIIGNVNSIGMTKH